MEQEEGYSINDIQKLIMEQNKNMKEYKDQKMDQKNQIKISNIQEINFKKQNKMLWRTLAIEWKQNVQTRREECRKIGRIAECQNKSRVDFQEIDEEI